MEKLPQRNLLLPNAPITPFSTSKKNKHPFKQMLSTSGYFSYIFRVSLVSGSCYLFKIFLLF
jgi:hypothetical protein